MAHRTVGMSQAKPLNRQINTMIETVTKSIRLRFNNRIGPHFTQWAERLQAIRLSINFQSLLTSGLHYKPFRRKSAKRLRETVGDNLLNDSGSSNSREKETIAITSTGKDDIVPGGSKSQ